MEWSASNADDARVRATGEPIMQDPIDEAALHMIMAELWRRDAIPRSLPPTVVPNAPAVTISVGDTAHLIRVKGYAGRSPRWRCIGGKEPLVFDQVREREDWVAIVGMGGRDCGPPWWVYVRPTHEVQQEIIKRGRDHKPPRTGPFRELRICDHDDPEYYDAWQLYRDAHGWDRLGLGDPLADDA